MRFSTLLSLALVLSGPACSQAPQQDANGPRQHSSRPDLYACDGCDEALARAPETLESNIVLPPDGEPGEPFVLTGRVLMPDGETPAPDVVLYVHHTDAQGLGGFNRLSQRW